MPNIVISHNGKVPHISQNYDRIARQRTPYAGDAMLRYDFSQATQSTDTPYYNTIGSDKQWALTGTSFFETGYNYGTWSGASIKRLGNAFNGIYQFDSTVNQYVMTYAGSTPSGGYGLALFVDNPLSYNSGSATLFVVLKTPTTSPKNDKFFELISTTNSIALSWNDSLTLNKVSFGSYTSGVSKGVNCNFTANTWAIAVATYSYSGTNSNVYLKVNSQVATGSISTGTGTTNDSIGCITTATGSAIDIKVGEVIMYNGILSSVDIDEVEFFLKQKWNISY